MTSVLSAAEFGRVRAFVEVAEARSFTRAAQVLGVSPSALSQMVRLLEESIGSHLLNRTTRSVSLTEAGARLLHRAKGASEELIAGIREAANQHEEVVGIVRIHSFRIAADLFLRPLLRSFNESYPKVILDITLDDRVIDFVRENFEAAVRLREVIDKDLIAVKLGPDLKTDRGCFTRLSQTQRCSADPRGLEISSMYQLALAWTRNPVPMGISPEWQMDSGRRGRASGR